MKALDTNVLARFFVDDPDDPQAARQRPAAVASLSQPAFVSTTVLLEFEWLLRGFYGFKPAQIAGVLRALAGIEHVKLEHSEQALMALDAYEQAGLDFADALHLAAASHCEALLSFDRQFSRRAAKRGLQPRVELLKPL